MPSTTPLLEVSATPHALPWKECPAAGEMVGKLVGVQLDGLRSAVPKVLQGIESCTHLTNELRELADVPYLAGVDRERVMAATRPPDAGGFRGCGSPCRRKVARAASTISSRCSTSRSSTAISSRAENPPQTFLPHLYGGQVAAQAARAAGLTVPEGRFLHSLHGYFLRPGRSDRPTILRVDRDRDGRSFSARHVNALQNGEVILSLLVSFHIDREGRELQEVELPTAPPPDEIPEQEIGGHNTMFDLRPDIRRPRRAEVARAQPSLLGAHARRACPTTG